MIRPGSRLRVIRLLVGTFLLAAVGGLLARCALNRGQEKRNAAAVYVGSLQKASIQSLTSSIALDTADAGR
jgi:hypothetical protein